MATKLRSYDIDSSVNYNKYINLPEDFDSDRISDVVVEMDGSALKVNSDYEVARYIGSKTYYITWKALLSTAIEKGKTLDVTYPYVESERDS